ncbi:MAG TPA: tetratricopeptide repeat protein, partial [Myxococcales bacterium]|nr:tetratricopeptide repeat protein [Myxococcales bacterium]
RELLLKALDAEPPRLDGAALAIAALEYPEVDLRWCERSLGVLAERVRSLRAGDGPLEGVQALRSVLADEEGYRGNHDDYQDPDNSFLNRLLERKVGLPITLSVLYLEVARRARVPLFGVSFPGHFLVAIELDEDRKLVLDPFNSGDLLTEAGCEDLLRRVAPQVKFTPAMLVPATVRAISYRMLNNLKKIYLDRGDGDRALGVVDLMLTLAPDHPGELRARANILSALGAYRAALRDVERCLELSPDAPDHDSLVMTAKALRQRVELLN